MLDQKDVLKILASHCKDIYIQQRELFNTNNGESRTYRPAARWGGGVWRGRKQPNCWKAMAKYFVKNEFDPRVCMACIFNNAAVQTVSGPPNPNQMYPSKKEHLKNAMADYRFELKAELAIQAASARRFLLVDADDYGYGDESLDYMVGNSTLSLSPLFCYCLTLSEKRTDLSDKLESAAMLQLLSSIEAYEEAWENWIPTDLVKNTRQLLSVLKG
jgi:hypothetical protein